MDEIIQFNINKAKRLFLLKKKKKNSNNDMYSSRNTSYAFMVPKILRKPALGLYLKNPFLLRCYSKEGTLHEHFTPPNQGGGGGGGDPSNVFKRNDVLMYSQKPVNYIESVKANGFHLANRLLITSPDKEGSVVGTLLLDTETFEVNLTKPTKGFDVVHGFMIEFSEEVLQVFSKIHPKPELCVIGLGGKSRMLGPRSKQYFLNVGIQVESAGSNNAAQIYDLLATERPKCIAALLLPPNV